MNLHLVKETWIGETSASQTKYQITCCDSDGLWLNSLWAFRRKNGNHFEKELEFADKCTSWILDLLVTKSLASIWPLAHWHVQAWKMNSFYDISSNSHRNQSTWMENYIDRILPPDSVGHFSHTAKNFCPFICPPLCMMASSWRKPNLGLELILTLVSFCYLFQNSRRKAVSKPIIVFVKTPRHPSLMPQYGARRPHPEQLLSV